MKKIFTLILGLLVTVAMFAADRRPTVTVNASKKYEIVIDGRRYSSNYGNAISISNMFNGRHSVQVYEQRSSFFMKRKLLIASSTFQLRNSDINIIVDRLGHLQITESRFGRDWNEHQYGRDNDHYGRDNDHDRKDRDYDRSF